MLFEHVVFSINLPHGLAQPLREYVYLNRRLRRRSSLPADGWN
jgi:hypothetical protein